MKSCLILLCLFVSGTSLLRAAQDKPAQPPATQNATAGQTAQPAVLAPGTRLLVRVVECAESSSLEQVPFRTSSVTVHEKLEKEFRKGGRFLVVPKLDDAQLVFFTLEYWKGHRQNYVAVAVTKDEYKKHMEWLNQYRGVAYVQDMMDAALWASGKKFNSGKAVTAAVASAGLLRLGQPNPADLVKQFEAEVDAFARDK
jgi:hypothetical protein